MFSKKEFLLPGTLFFVKELNYVTMTVPPRCWFLLGPSKVERDGYGDCYFVRNCVYFTASHTSDQLQYDKIISTLRLTDDLIVVEPTR
jgi:hypothetical protein